MKPRIKAKQTTRGGLPICDYSYGYDGIESTADLIAIRFIREIASQNESSMQKEIVEYKSPEIKKPECNQTGLGWWIVFTAAFLGSLVVSLTQLCS